MTEIKTICIIGAGKLGVDLFNFFIDLEFPVILVANKNTSELYDKFIKKIKRKLNNELISKNVYENITNFSKITSDLNETASADLIIECITENLETKKHLFEKLKDIIRKDTLIATNSSSIVPSKFKIPELEKRLFGLHFFYPVKMKDIIEIIIPDNIDPSVINKIEKFLRSIKRFHINLNEKNAFILNKYLLESQAFIYNFCIKNSLSFREADNIIKKTYTFGIFEQIDEIGIDILLYSAKNYTALKKNIEFYEPFIKKLEELVKKNKLGKKTKSGFFNYSGDFSTSNIINTDFNLEKKFYKEMFNFELDSYYKIIEENILSKDDAEHAFIEFYGDFYTKRMEDAKNKIK